MSYRPLVSIVINNYNYARFVKEAIDSAIKQTYSLIEVIVVDDGSTDNSQEIIASYGDRIISVFQENGGQASAFNAGFAASKGEIICFLDADDVFVPNKVSQIVDLFAQINQSSNITLFHSLEAIDENSKSLKFKRDESCELSDLNYQRALNRQTEQKLTKISTSSEVYQHARKYRYVPYLAAPTSGLILNRSLAQNIFPLPCEGIKTSADDFVVKAAALLSDIYATDLVLAGYRIHNSNNWYGKKRPHQYSFLCQVDEYLNSKLQSINQQPVLSYFDSLHATKYYQGYYGEDSCKKKRLLLAIKAVTWHTNLRTIKFFIKTTYQINIALLSSLFNGLFNLKLLSAFNTKS